MTTRKAQPLRDLGFGGGGGSADKTKLIVAVVAFVIAAGMFAWYFGLFGGKSKPKGPVISAQEKAAQDAEGKKQDADRLEKLKSGKEVQGGA
ncbi:MAG: hypothetical protein H6811_04765 [Phycisphaeraceae bacterium]|nr:hypothetical protein [Phycisphaeraceae bacterium]